jgi:hypothetical protein
MLKWHRHVEVKHCLVAQYHNIFYIIRRTKMLRYELIAQAYIEKGKTQTGRYKKPIKTLAAAKNEAEAHLTKIITANQKGAQPNAAPHS